MRLVEILNILVWIMIDIIEELDVYYLVILEIKFQNYFVGVVGLDVLGVYCV